MTAKSRTLLLITVAAWLTLGFMVALVVWQLLYAQKAQHLNIVVPIVVTGIVVSVATLFLVTPKLVLANLSARRIDGKGRFEIENETRKTLALILGGASILTGSYFSWQQYQLSQRKDTDELTSKSVEQLSNPNVSVRLGGLQGLQVVLERDPAKYDEVIDYMVAYLHDHYGADPREGLCYGDESLAAGQIVEKARVLKIGVVTPPDLRKIANFLSTNVKAGTKDNRLDLSQLDLCGVRVLNGGHFEFAAFDMSNLRRGNFQYSFFDHAEFNDVNANALTIDRTPRSALFNCSRMRGAMMRGGGFRGTSFSHAELQDALLSGADLTGASFYESDLRDADLKGAVLRGAHLNRSNLQGVKIDDKTDLSGADLSDVVGLCVDDIIAAGVITDKDTKSPPLKCQKNPSWQEDGCLPKEDHR